MIDYVKILLKDIDVNRLNNLPFLDFKREVNENTGELSSTKTSSYHFCKITVFDSGTILFTGSLHKFYNSLKGIYPPNYKLFKTYKGFNGNQFTIDNILEVRTQLEDLFKCDSEQMIFQNIEFGINTTPNFNPQLFIKGLLFHYGKSFEFRYNSNYAQVKHQRYLLKIYNKSNQYKMNINTLRVELKIVKTEFLKCTEIKTFDDITSLNLDNAKNLLLKVFNDVVYYDYSIETRGLKTIQRDRLKLYSNPRYWINDLNPRHRHREKKRLFDLIENNSKNLQALIKKEIEEKCVINNYPR